jgi:hypothetical protein
MIMTDEQKAASDAEMMRQYMEGRMQDRLFHLERADKRLRARIRLLNLGLLVALGLAGAAFLWPGALGLSGGSEDPETLTVGGLVLVDGNGDPRGEWMVDDEGNSRFTLQDRQGKVRLSLSVLSTGSPGLSLIDSNGRRRAALGLLPDQTTSLVFADESGIARAVLGLGRGDATHLVFADARGDSQVALGLDGSGVGTMMLPQGGAEGMAPDDQEDSN